MSTILIDKLEKLLNEEKWTRATINNYTIKNFESLNQLLKEYKENDLSSEIKQTTEEYLKHNKNSIVALYITSMLQIEERNMEDNNIYNLIKIFTDNLKWNIVEYLCKRVLKYIDDKVIIKILINTYINLNKKEALPELWEKLIKVDYEEADIVVSLAKIKEEKNEIEEAVVLYKKAINRYILNKNFVQVEELWKKLLNFDTIGYEYFFNLDKKISKTFSIDRSIELLKLLYEQTALKDEYDFSIKIIKLIIEKSPNDDFCRKEIIQIYQKKYANHSQLEEYIKISNLEGSWRNIHDAIDSFEKHIAFDKNNFVSHRTWGIGRIVDVTKDIFTINFQNKKNHKMSLKMALTSLQILPKNHIWILKLKNLALLKEKVNEDIPWTLKMIITSYNNEATLKIFKDELVPDVLSEAKWTNWWASARKILKTDPGFGTKDNSNSIFEVRDKPLSFEEKTSISFKNAKDFNQRLSIILDYLENTDPDPDPDYLEEMLVYFTSFLNSINNVNEQTIISYLLTASIAQKFAFISQNTNYSFIDFFNEIDDKVDMYQNLVTAELKKEYLIHIKKHYSEWVDIFIRIFYLYPNKFIYEELYNKDFSLIQKIIKDIYPRYKEYTDAYFWLVTNVITDKFIKKLNIEMDMDNIIFSIIHLLDISAKNISIKNDLIKNKKKIKQLKDYLMKDDLLINYIDQSNKNFSKRLFTIINDLVSLDSEYVIKIKNKITSLYPDIDTDQALKFDFAKTSKNDILDKLLTTQESYKRMQEEMLYIKDVEIPKNSKEIGWAMEKGDLRENAEYKAAKEQQTFLQAKLNKLINDLSKAVIIKKDDISGEYITFGTNLKLIDKMNNDNILEYTILGPWESQTEKNIISYQSPLGFNLLDKRSNEEVMFIINDKKYHYIIKEISLADF